MLKEKFSSFKYTSGSIGQHISELGKLVLQMTSGEFRPDEEDISLTLLRSLPSTYESLVQAIRLSMVKLSSADVMSKVLFEAIRLKDKDMSEPATAMFGNKDKKDEEKHTGKKKFKKNIVCFKCGKRGHYSRECHSNPAHNQSNVAFAACSEMSNLNTSCWIVAPPTTCALIKCIRHV